MSKFLVKGFFVILMVMVVVYLVRGQVSWISPVAALLGFVLGEVTLALLARGVKSPLE